LCEPRTEHVIPSEASNQDLSIALLPLNDASKKERNMSDLPEQIAGKVVGDLDPFKKILSYIPGFKGYMERQSRRDSDKLLRDTIANRFEEQWQRVSAIQRDLINQGGLAYVDDLEAAAIQLRTFADRIRRATRGYSSLFEATKINQTELSQIYQYDAAMLVMADQVSAAVDNLEASIGSDGLPAAIRHLVSTARDCQRVFDRREEVVFTPAGSQG